jgi:16S rRNA (guanine527-N7)-methyltransferase
MIEALRVDLDHLGLGQGPPQASELAAYLALLVRWNGVYNLTSVRDPQAMRLQHLVDCLAVLKPLRARWGDRSDLRVLDVGSGGGLPGVVLALAHRDWQVDCVDAVSKKAAFVRQVAVELGLPRLRGLHQRVETLSPVPAYDLVVCRAYGSLNTLVAGTKHLLAPGGCWMAMKGKVPHDEIAALSAQEASMMPVVEPLTVPGLTAERCLVWLERSA